MRTALPHPAAIERPARPLKAAIPHRPPVDPRSFTRGVADGVQCRSERGRPSAFLLVARDDYAAGYRAGYFERDRSNGRSTVNG